MEAVRGEKNLITKEERKNRFLVRRKKCRERERAEIFGSQCQYCRNWLNARSRSVNTNWATAGILSSLVAGDYCTKKLTNKRSVFA